MNKSVNVHRNSASFTRHNAGGLSLITGFMPVTTEMALFDYPFNELLVRNPYLFCIFFNILFQPEISKDDFCEGHRNICISFVKSFLLDLLKDFGLVSFWLHTIYIFFHLRRSNFYSSWTCIGPWIRKGFLGVVFGLIRRKYINAFLSPPDVGSINKTASDGVTYVDAWRGSVS